MDPTVSSPIGQLNAFNNPNSSGEDQSYQPNVPSTPPSTRRSQRSTPPRNILAQSRLSEDAKMRLSNVAPDQKRCLITLVDRPLQCSHILPRATSPDILRMLEYAWGMKLRSLNIDTSRNLIWLDNSTHSLFDSSYWVLVPTLQELEKIRNLTVEQLIYPNRPKFTESFPHAIREFTFAQLLKLDRPYFRFDNYPLEYSAHFPPFTSLSPIRSHIHPYFAICNVAQKDARLRPTLTNLAAEEGYETLAHDETLLVRVRLCRTIYQLWTSLKPLTDSDLLAPPNSYATHSSSQSGVSSGHSTTSRRSMPNRGAKRNRGDGSNNVSNTWGGGNDLPQLHVGASTIPTDALLTPGASQGAGSKRDILGSSREPAVAPYWSKVENWLKTAETSACADGLCMTGDFSEEEAPN